MHLGSFVTREAAAITYLAAASKHRGDFARPYISDAIAKLKLDLEAMARAASDLLETAASR
jgi:hypothetical protein